MISLPFYPIEMISIIELVILKTIDHTILLSLEYEH